MKNFEHRTALYAIPWTSLLGGWLLGASSGEHSETIGAWLLLGSALLLGLPHGAYDFWILFDSTHRKSRFSGVFFWLVTTYLTLALFVVGVWYFLPSVVWIGFLALSAWHFGSGDAIWETEGRTDWFVNSFGRGLLVISAPLAFYQSESAAVLAKLDAGSTPILLSAAPYTLTMGVLLIALSNFAALFRASERKTANHLSTLLETAFVLIFFWLTTPLLAVTVYLIGVHSWRHLLRLEIYHRSEKFPKRRNLRQIIVGFHRRALPITVVSLTGLSLIFWLWQFRLADLSNYTSAYLVLLSALTVPHAALITWTEIKLSTNPRPF